MASAFTSSIKEGGIRSAKLLTVAIVAELLELQADYQQWLDGLPESLADTPTADALRVVCDLDLSGLGTNPPRGVGRD